MPAVAAEMTDQQWRKLDDAARNRKRNVIWNNDSCEMWEVPGTLPREPASALQPRMSQLPGGQVDTVFYGPLHSGFSHVKYPTRVGAR